MNKKYKWILIVDDELEIRESLKKIISESFDGNVKVITAKDGMEASLKINHQSFDCIITDMKMPRKEGGAFIKSVRENTSNETTPVIILSGHSSPEVEKEHKFVNFLQKPFDPQELLQLIKNHLNLETTEKMVSANILNLLLESTSSFLNHYLGQQELEIGKATLKKSGETIALDYMAILSVKIGKVSNTFSIIFDTKTLEKIKLSQEKLKNKSLSQISRTTGFVILKDVLRSSEFVDETTLTTNDIKADKEQLKDKQGLMVPLKGDSIYINVFATTKQP